MTSTTVAEYMIKDVVSVSPDMTVAEVSEKMIDSNFHGFPITERGYLLGFVTAKELLRFHDQRDAKMRAVMKRGTICCNPEMSIDDAVRVLFRYGIRNLPVVDSDKKLVGIISNIDIGAYEDANTGLIFHPIGYPYTEDNYGEGAVGDYYSTVSSFEGTFDGYGHRIVASKYPNVTKEYFRNRGLDVEVVKIDGSVELEDIDRSFGPTEGWENFGGIIRDVSLIYKEKALTKAWFYKTIYEDVEDLEERR